MVKLDKNTSSISLLQEARLKRGWSQDELAEQIGTTSVNISRWEHSITSPRSYFRLRLCDVFGKSVTELGLMPFPQGSRLVSVPSKRNPFFTGREELLAMLHKRLSITEAVVLTQATKTQKNSQTRMQVQRSEKTQQEQQGPQAQALFGLGGIGKTQTALEYAYRYENEYTAIFWVRAATREMLTADFVNIARLLDLVDKEVQDSSYIVSMVKRWLTNNQDWLLIFDNADDLSLAQEFLPDRHNGSILFTTCDQATGDIAENIEIEPLNLQTGILLLLRRSKRLAKEATLDEAKPTDRVTAGQIVQEMGGLPLAIVQAAAYIEDKKCSLTDYLTLYTTHRQKLLAHRSRHLLDYPDTVDTAWSLSFQQVEEQSQNAANLLRLLAFLSNDAIPEALFTRGATTLEDDAGAALADLYQFNEALDVLLRYSLVRRDSETHILTIHRLVQTVLKEHMSNETQRIWAERTVRLVNMAFPVENYAASTNLHHYAQYYLPHIQECATLIEQYQLYSPEAAQLLHQAGAFLYTYGLYSQSKTFHQQAFSIREQVLGSDNPDVAESLNYLALLSRLEENDEQAEMFYQKALSIREKTLGSEHPKTAISLNNLGVLYTNQGKFHEAEPLFQRALNITEKVLGEEHPHTLTVLINVAKMNMAQGNYEQAKHILKHTLTVIEQTANFKHLIIAQNFHLLAQTFYKQGEYEQAELFLRRAIAVIEQLRGREHPALAEILNSLAELYVVQGRYIDAELLCQRAVHIGESKLGEEHPATCTYHKHLAEIVNKKSAGVG